MGELQFFKHTIEKLDSWKKYANDWFDIVRSQKCCIIDCYAGTGYNNIKGLNKKVMGSSLVAVSLFKKYSPENLKVYLVEKDKENHQKLIENVKKYIMDNNLNSKIGTDIKIFNDDWKAIINDLINETNDRIRLYFFDPFAMKSLSWNDLSLLLEKGKSPYNYKETGIEVLINWPWHAIRRKIGIYFTSKTNPKPISNLGAEIEILNSFFGEFNWKEIADKYNPDIFKKHDREKVKELRNELLFEYSKLIKQYFKYVKIHSVYSRKKGKKGNVIQKGTVKYHLIFASNYYGALDLIDRGFRKYREKDFFSKHQQSLTKYYEKMVENNVENNEKTITIHDRILSLERELEEEIWQKNKDIIEFLYEKWTQDYGCYDFVLKNQFHVNDYPYLLKFLLDKGIVAVRTKISKTGYIGDFYYLIHPFLVDRNEYLFYDKKHYLYKDGEFQVF